MVLWDNNPAVKSVILCPGSKKMKTIDFICKQQETCMLSQNK